MTTGVTRPAAAQLWRRLASLCYEALLVAALLLATTVFFYIVFPSLISGALRLLLQLTLAAVLTAYFLWCWCHGGQTLPMKAWKIRLVDGAGIPPSPSRALTRFVLAALTLGSACAGLAVLWKKPHEVLGWSLLAPGLASLVWALLDRDRQFLHDRLAGTHIVSTVPAQPEHQPKRGQAPAD
ncbi:MAG: RDD family protein [Betaproteobacteria bacterium]|nr:RDD family protein [Pseudomonadota bacterium]